MSQPAPASGAGEGHDAAVFWGILEAAPDGFALVDGAGVIMLVNRQTEALFGYDRTELIGRSVECLLPERVRSRHRDHRARYAADPHTRPMGMGLDLVGRRKDGTDFPVEVSLSPLDEHRIIAVVRDITARRDAEILLRRRRGGPAAARGARADRP